MPQETTAQPATPLSPTTSHKTILYYVLTGIILVIIIVVFIIISLMNSGSNDAALLNTICKDVNNGTDIATNLDTKSTQFSNSLGQADIEVNIKNCTDAITAVTSPTTTTINGVQVASAMFSIPYSDKHTESVTASFSNTNGTDKLYSIAFPGDTIPTGSPDTDTQRTEFANLLSSTILANLPQQGGLPVALNVDDKGMLSFLQANGTITHTQLTVCSGIDVAIMPSSSTTPCTSYGFPSSGNITASEKGTDYFYIPFSGNTPIISAGSSDPINNYVIGYCNSSHNVISLASGINTTPLSSLVRIIDRTTLEPVNAAVPFSLNCN